MLKQKVNFYACVGLIFTFGFFVSVTVVQALSEDAPLLEHISSPIDIASLK